MKASGKNKALSEVIGKIEYIAELIDEGACGSAIIQCNRLKEFIEFALAKRGKP